MKGHARIELTDVHTGEKQVIEEDNLITNAVSEYVKPIAFCGYTPLYRGVRTYGLLNMLFGGLLLLDSAVEENPDIIRLPYGIDVVGRGSDIAYTGVDTFLGSLNINESGYDESGNYKFVWDFTTSQANGVIASLSLTSHFGGRLGYGWYSRDASITSNMQDSVFFNGVSWSAYSTALLCKSNNNNEINAYECGYVFCVGDNIYTTITHNLRKSSLFSNFYIKNSGCLSIAKIKIPISSVILNNRNFNSADVAKDFDEIIDIPLPDVIKNGLEGSKIYGGFYQCGSSMYMIMLNKQYIEAEEQINIFKVDFLTMESETISFKNTTGKRIGFVEITGNSCQAWFAVSNGNFICNCYNNGVFEALYRINMSNPADVFKFENKGTDVIKVRQLFFFTISSGFIVSRGDSYSDAYIVNVAKGKYCSYNIEGVNQLSTTSNENLTKIVRRFSSGGNECVDVVNNPFYLATINNLATPVQKTASQTMKITYTLSELNESEPTI